jgi:hypothetical protein
MQSVVLRGIRLGPQSTTSMAVGTAASVLSGQGAGST